MMRTYAVPKNMDYKSGSQTSSSESITIHLHSSYYNSFTNTPTKFNNLTPTKQLNNHLHQQTVLIITINRHNDYHHVHPNRTAANLLYIPPHERPYIPPIPLGDAIYQIHKFLPHHYHLHQHQHKHHHHRTQGQWHLHPIKYHFPQTKHHHNQPKTNNNNNIRCTLPLDNPNLPSRTDQSSRLPN